MRSFGQMQAFKILEVLKTAVLRHVKTIHWQFNVNVISVHKIIAFCFYLFYIFRTLHHIIIHKFTQQF